MAAITIHSDFVVQTNRICHGFPFFPLSLSWSDRTVFHDLSFLNIEFQVSFLTLLFHTLKGLISSSLVSAFKQTFTYWHPVILAPFIKKTDVFFPHEVTFTPLSEISWQCMPSSVISQSLSCVWLFATSWTAVHQASLSITNSQSLLKLMSIKSVMTSNHLILYHPLLFLPSNFPSIRVFSSEWVLRIRWPNYWSFSFSISRSNECSGLLSLGLIGWISLQFKGLSRVFSNTTVQKHQSFGA